MRYVVLALALAFSSAVALPAAAADCARQTTGLTPIPDLGAGTYKGLQGGLYGRGTNAPPEPYASEGRRAASEIVPRASSGAADAGGKIALLSIGMSNTTQEFATFVKLANTDPVRDAQVVVVDGAQGGQDARVWADPKARTWTVADDRLARAGVGPAQVQAVWLKQAIARPSGDFASSGAQLETALSAIVANAKARYPNLAQVFVSPRTYAGYAVTELNPEPYAYESGFVARRLVDRSVREPAARPWIGWGPYLWTDGTNARSDGLVWACGDVQQDGVHPAPSGQAKVAQQLQAFFAGSEFTAWYRGDAPAIVAAPAVVPDVPAPGGDVPAAAHGEVRLDPALLAAGALAIGAAGLVTLRKRRRP
jgi:hypothetical protein